ncbi:unnamed protein product, partial [Polarella glacialis]
GLMGQSAGGPSPVTVKESGNETATSKPLSWGYSCMQGWRYRMEDAHFALESLDDKGWADTAAFGVMDGHGGREVAFFCAQFLPSEIARGSSADVPTTLVRAFHRMDELLLQSDQQDLLRSFTGDSRDGGSGPPLADPNRVGCTAVVCLVRPDVIIVGNAGDSRAVLSRRGLAVPLSEDHKPNLPGERERIRKAGGSIERQEFGPIVQYRVNGNLNLSRSIGDLNYKKNPSLQASEQTICSTPDVSTFLRQDEDEFLLIACDGIWEILSSQDAVDFVNARLPKHLESGQPLSWILEDLLDHCLSPDLNATSGLGGDNMTAMLVLLEKGVAAEAGRAEKQSRKEPIGGQPIRSLNCRSGDQDGIEDQAFGAAGFCSCGPTNSRQSM